MRGWLAGTNSNLFIEKAAIELVAVSVEHVQAARRGWRRFGKGNHPAGLNFEDCFAYALAEVTGESLLYKGDDFALTDVESAKQMRSREARKEWWELNDDHSTFTPAQAPRAMLL